LRISAPDHERQGVRQRHRLGVAIEVLGSKTTRLMVLCAFDLLVEDRKRVLARLIRKPRPGSCST
jgi:hypothetical protein